MVNQAHDLEASVQAYINEDDEAEVVSKHTPLPVRLRPVVHGMTKQVALGTAAVLIVGPNVNRKSVKITNVTGTLVCYIGFNVAPTSSSGDVLGASAGSNIVTDAQDAIWGLSTAAQTVSVLEEEYSA